MTLQNIWSDDRQLGRAFSWLTRIGVAPKFGTLPIAYYQQDQCKAIDALTAALKAHSMGDSAKVRVHGGLIMAQSVKGQPWRTVAMVVCGRIVAR